ncbi:hypothetical protein [Burkholderia glumae]|uniref:hypothetical protein n=1 Tax=Burkholderia glumae TaxID=337 RepID=UPI00214F996E|nr:hypothetical protein [Burkholderia glumae]
MEMMTLKIVGSSPLMMHADKLANPLAAETIAHRELTSKRKKVEADHIAIARSEFLAGLYHAKGVGVYIPAANFEATFKAAAKLQRLGTQWTRGAVVMTDKAKLVYDGPAEPEKLWEDRQFVDCRGVKVGAAKLMRYRPVFMEWACEIELAYSDEVLDRSEIEKIILDAGQLIGVCEYRPRFGRFTVEVS